MIKIGCCGYTMATRKYYDCLNLVEINRTFYKFPKMTTVKKWREEAPKASEFTVKANKVISHEYKLDAGESCLSGFERMRTICEILEARILLIQTAASFTPDSICTAEGFFRKISRGQLTLLWETRGRAWDDSKARKKLADVLGKVNVVHVTDPFKMLPAHTDEIAYFRLHGLGERMYYYQYSNEELEKLHRITRSFEEEGKVVYVLFNNLSMFDDALRFEHFLEKKWFPRVTGEVGLESVMVLTGKIHYPVTKAVLLRRLGWKLVDLEEGKQARLGEILKNAQQEMFLNPADITKAVKSLIKSS
jgi:uncharacterized protein YecE (DUF72 family)